MLVIPTPARRAFAVAATNISREQIARLSRVNAYSTAHVGDYPGGPIVASPYAQERVIIGMASEATFRAYACMMRCGYHA